MIPPELLQRIDEALGDVVERDVAKTADRSPRERLT